MAEEVAIPIISVEELCGHIEDQDFSECFGDPVEIQTSGDRKYICMKKESYDKLSSALEDDEDDDYEIKYWIYEFEFAGGFRKEFEETCSLYGMSPQELLYSIIWNFCRIAKKEPERIKKIHEEHMAEVEAGKRNPDEVKLIRCYPVYWNESEAQAHDRCVREEQEQMEKVGNGENGDIC